MTLWVPISHPPSSGCVMVLVEGASESVSSVCLEMSDLPWFGKSIRAVGEAEPLAARPGAADGRCRTTRTRAAQANSGAVGSPEPGGPRCSPMMSTDTHAPAGHARA